MKAFTLLFILTLNTILVAPQINFKQSYSSLKFEAATLVLLKIIMEILLLLGMEQMVCLNQVIYLKLTVLHLTR
ncbi:MAG: hypothetical protein DRI94_14825 [Bacteroidetes bacterium]|nr:MAG: hypothetical protein DRI94_14825 [Bacteroidota bacterium]